MPGAHAQRSFTITGPCGIPGDAQAVSFNFTVWAPVTRGDIRVFPAGGGAPTVATMLWEANILGISNAAIVPLGTGGAITVQVDGPGTIDLIVDVNGYYSPLGVVNSVNGLTGAVTLAGGGGTTVVPSGNTLTITAPAGWNLAGNSGTVPGTNYIGTTDNQALEIKVNGARAFRLEPTSFAPNVVGGHSSNQVSSFVSAATISGGGDATGSTPNRVTDSFGTVGGGTGNRAGGLAPAAGGGGAATVGGGMSNSAIAGFATVAGGGGNLASGGGAAVPGGVGNVAGGDYSFAAGLDARVRDAATAGNTTGDQGTFVWADAQGADTGGVPFISTGTNQFLVRAQGGVGINTNSPSASTTLTVMPLVAGGNTVVFSPTGANLSAQQGGSLELGASDNIANTSSATPYIDFHYGVGAAQDFNVRLINDASGRLRVYGNLDVQGSLSKLGGSFRIDHPLDPENKYLFHSFVESPDMMNIYNGNVATDEKGYATVELPEWFEALNRDFRYQLTVIDEADGDGFVQAKVVKGVTSNRFTLRTSSPNTRVSWQVTGIRKDAWAEKHRIPVEEIKPEGQRGWFLNPELFGRE
jgi:hypothetical protein